MRRTLPAFTADLSILSLYCVTAGADLFRPKYYSLEVIIALEGTRVGYKLSRDYYNIVVEDVQGTIAIPGECRQALAISWVLQSPR
jgi:hypothetical protein